jgi:hypothetical protein
VALVAALGLLMLGAALLAGSAVASMELRRATRGLVASARADGEGRRALGEILQRWDAEASALPVGGTLDRIVPASVTDGPSVVVHSRIRRLTSRLYAASVSVSVGGDEASVAVRRMRLLLERAPDGDSTGTSPPVVPVARWRVEEHR